MIDELKVTDTKLPVTILEDNQSAIQVARGNEQPRRLKHTDIKYHFVQQKLRERIINLRYLDSQNQVADILTKPLGKTKFIGFVKCLNLNYV